MVLPLTGGGHEGGGAHRRPNIHKQKAEHGRAVYCYATASGPLRGGDAERGSAGNTEVVGSDGNIMGEGQGKGSGNVIGVQLGDRHGGGGGEGNRKHGKRLKWGGMERSECGASAERVRSKCGASAERVRTNGKYGKLDKILHKTESRDRVAAVLVLEKPPNNEHAICSR